jgi:protein required for attachment to host cells
MPKLKIAKGAWVVVCDGAKALILENAGDEMYPNLKTREVHAQRDPRTREEGADKPGRVHRSASTARSAVEQTGWHNQSEQGFLQDLAGRLDAAVASGEAETLVIVAPPKALGMLREAYSPALRAAIRCEIDKDYVRMPLHEIERHLAQVVPA